MQKLMIYLGITIFPVLSVLLLISCRAKEDSYFGLLNVILTLPFIVLLWLVVLVVNHILFFKTLRRNGKKARQLLIHTWLGVGLTVFLWTGIWWINFLAPELFGEMSANQVMAYNNPVLSQLQKLFVMPSENEVDETRKENGGYLYAGGTVKKLKVEHVGKCQYEGRVIFELAGQEYSRPIALRYSRKTIDDEPEWTFDLVHGDYANTPDELREDVLIAFRDWFQNKNKGLDNWDIEEIETLSSEHPRYTFHLKCVRIGNTGKKHYAETNLELTFETLSHGRYHPAMKFYDTDHEMLHSYFMYYFIGRKMKDGTTVKECRLKKCTGNIDTFTVRFSDNVVNSIYVSFEDNFTWKFHKKER